MRESGDLTHASDAMNIIQNVWPNLRLDLLTARCAMAEKTISVTREMVEAGVEAYYFNEIGMRRDSPIASDVVVAVFKAMIDASSLRTLVDASDLDDTRDQEDERVRMTAPK